MDDSTDKLAIREVIENWALWRDAGDWDRFATCWHEDGWMTATWFQGPAASFIEAGASAIGVGADLVDVKAIRAGGDDKVTETTRAYIEAVRSAREQKAESRKQ